MERENQMRRAEDIWRQLAGLRGGSMFFNVCCLAVALSLAPASGAASQSSSDPDAADRTLVATVREAHRIGGAEAEPWEAFSESLVLRFSDAGSLIVLDRMQSRVVVVDAEGLLSNEISRSGEGPGEFQTPIGLATLSGERILVTDMRHRSNFLFDSTGAFVEGFPTSETSLEEVIGSPTEFNVNALVPASVAGSFPDDRLLTVHDGLRRVEILTLGEGSETVYQAWKPATKAGEDLNISRGNARVMIQGMPRQVAFAPELEARPLSDGRVAVVDSVGYRVKLLRTDGSIDRVLTRPIDPIEVTQSMRDAETERRGSSTIVSGSGGREFESAIREMFVSNLDFASHVPVVQEILVDREDRIWVTRTAEDGVSEGPTDIFTGEGEYMGTLPPDRPGRPEAFGPGGLMAFHERDDLDVPVIRVVRLLDLKTAGG